MGRLSPKDKWKRFLNGSKSYYAKNDEEDRVDPISSVQKWGAIPDATGHQDELDYLNKLNS